MGTGASGVLTAVMMTRGEKAFRYDGLPVKDYEAAWLLLRHEDFHETAARMLHPLHEYSSP